MGEVSCRIKAFCRYVIMRELVLPTFLIILLPGNLASEQVTKRDVFHIFHRYGRIAQISIKQAYGFVQYYSAEACQAALNNQEGADLRGKKIRK